MLNDLDEREKKELLKKTNNEEEEIQKYLAEKVNSLNKAKNEEIIKKDNEIEYSTVLIHKIQTEKINLFNIHKKKVEILEKLSKIELSYKNIEKSSIISNIKTRNIETLSSNLKNEIKMMNNLIYIQNTKKGEIEQNVQRYQTEIIKSKENLKSKNLSLEKMVRNQKDDIKKNINSITFMKNTKVIKEKELVRLILGLDLIKRYLLTADCTETIKLLEESHDFKIFKATKINKMNEKKNKSQSLSTMTITQFSSPILESTLPATYRISSIDLKQKVDNLNIEYDELYDLYTKIINKKQFFHNIMSKYNFKQINLEILKENYTKKVSEILTKNYKNVNELIKSNSKIEKFIKKFQEFVITPTQVKEIYEFELVNKNKEFLIKCKSLVDEVKSFIQMISSTVNYISDSLTSEDESFYKISILNAKLKNYSKFLLSSENRSKDDFISQLFKEISSIPEYTEPEIVKRIIDSESKLDHFAQFRHFYKENKSSFVSVKLELQKTNFYTFSNTSEIEEIISILLEYITSQNINERRNNHFKSLSQNEVFFNSDLKKTQSKNKKKSNQFSSNQAILRTVNSEENSIIMEENLTNVNQLNIKEKANNGSKYFNKLYNSEAPNGRNYGNFLNENVGSILKETRKNLKDNFELKKKQGQIDKLTGEFLLYNNPRLNINSLSNETYNSFMKLIITNQVSKSKQNKVINKVKNV